MGLYLGANPTHSPFVEMIWQAHTESAGTFTSVAASTWELVIASLNGKTRIAVRGPETRASVADFPAGMECIGITFKLGAFMPHLPILPLLDRQDAILPGASRHSFWLYDSTWEIPRLDNADVFVSRLVRQGILVHDPLVEMTLRGGRPHLSPRALQYRFVRATGLSHKTIQQIERARRAIALLEQGTPILDTAFELGYSDQAHLTNSLRRFMGTTPAQIARKDVAA